MLLGGNAYAKFNLWGLFLCMPKFVEVVCFRFVVFWKGLIFVLNHYVVPTASFRVSLKPLRSTDCWLPCELTLSLKPLRSIDCWLTCELTLSQVITTA